VRTGGSSTEIVEIGAPDADGAVWARRAHDGALVRLPSAQARRFEPHPAALRARGVWRARRISSEIGESLRWDALPSQ